MDKDTIKTTCWVIIAISILLIAISYSWTVWQERKKSEVFIECYNRCRELDDSSVSDCIKACERTFEAHPNLEFKEK